MKKMLIICTVLATLFASADTAFSATYGVTSRADLSGDDYVDWGQQGYGTPYYGGPHAVGPYVRIPVPATSSNGIGLNVTNPPYNGTLIWMLIRQQSLSWGGNFAPGDILIGNQWDHSFPESHGPGPMTINLDEPVYGLGAQINAFNYGTFSALIEAFDSDWNSLGQVAFNGLQVAYTADNSASFIGILSDIGNISHAVIASGHGAFVINRLDLVTEEPTIPGTAFPASPGSTGLMLVQCEDISEQQLPENIHVNTVVTDGFSGTIYYTANGVNRTFTMYGGVLPMDVQINGVPASLADLEGADVKKLKAISDNCFGFDPSLNRYTGGTQWTVLASVQGGGGVCQCPANSPNGCISGSVRGLDGQPLADKIVKIIRIRPKPRVKLNSAVTDADGCYLFSDLEKGKYKIKVKGCKGGGRLKVKIKRGAKVNGVDFQCAR